MALLDDLFFEVVHEQLHRGLVTGNDHRASVVTRIVTHLTQNGSADRPDTTPYTHEGYAEHEFAVVAYDDHVQFTVTAEVPPPALEPFPSEEDVRISTPLECTIPLVAQVDEVGGIGDDPQIEAVAHPRHVTGLATKTRTGAPPCGSGRSAAARKSARRPSARRPAASDARP